MGIPGIGSPGEPRGRGFRFAAWGLALLLTAAAAGVVLAGAVLERPSPQRPMTELAREGEGRAPRPPWERTPSVAAAFTRDGYRPGQIASLELWRREHRFTVQIFRVSELNVPTWRRTKMQGIPVTGVRSMNGRAAHTPIRLRIGDWPSGVYYARLTTKRRFGFAPFVVRPSRLGVHNVLVVMPTFTWQAYNFRDDDGDGLGDTWYAGRGRNGVDLTRPYLARGVPPHFKYYDLPFISWLERTGKSVDFMSDSQLAEARSAQALKRAYTLIIFPGHHEYVNSREYDLIVGYRNLGGHLMFLSANNFYWKVERRGDRLVRVAEWRNLGRPEAALIGVQYIRTDGGARQRPWTVRDTTRHPWFYEDTELTVGSTFGNGGVEIDHTSPASPPDTTVLAAIPNLMGPGATAQMTYYETPRGAKVFAAGAFTLGGTREASSRRLLENLWDQLAGGDST